MPDILELAPAGLERPAASAVAPTPAYTVRLARSREDVRAAQMLRFLVFNVELHQGLESSYDTCLDADPFDKVCDHLLVEDRATGEVVGTYRLQTGRAAARGLGFYSEQEFDFAAFAPVRMEMLELGRACVAPAYRSLGVLRRLWQGIAAYARQHGARYLVGCGSLNSQDPRDGAALFRLLARGYLAPARFRAAPREDFACPLPAPRPGRVQVPKLLAAYLLVGARVCGPPALDRQFKTIDFLTLLDLETLSPRAVAHYLQPAQALDLSGGGGDA